MVPSKFPTQRYAFVRPKRSLPRQTRSLARWPKIPDPAAGMGVARAADLVEEAAAKDLGQVVVVAGMPVPEVEDREAKVLPGVEEEVSVDRAAAAAALAPEGHRVPGVHRLDLGLNELGLARCTSLRQRRANGPN